MRYADSIVYSGIRKYHKRERNEDILDPKMKDADCFFNAFLNEDLETPFIVNNYGVDLSSPNAYKDLRSQGVSIREAKMQIQIFENWQKNAEKFSADTIRETKYVAAISRFGWINMDRFYKNPKSVPIKLLVKVENVNPEKYFCLFSF